VVAKLNAFQQQVSNPVGQTYGDFTDVSLDSCLCDSLNATHQLLAFANFVFNASFDACFCADRRLNVNVA
jgi:hypothetical protein